MTKRNILMIAARYAPHIGGVEKHLENLNAELIRRGFSVSVLTEKYDEDLPDSETGSGVSVYRQRTKRIHGSAILGLPLTHIAAFRRYRSLFRSADIIHCHDYLPFLKFVLPFRFIYPRKKYFITFHGWEGRVPPRRSVVLLRKMCERLTVGNICAGDFITKWYGVRADYVTYGASSSKRVPNADIRYDCCYAGRLERDTNVDLIVRALDLLKTRYSRNLKSVICGDGSLRDSLSKTVRNMGLDCAFAGFVDDVDSYIGASRIVFANSYLAIIEALQQGKAVFSIYNNELKKDYLTMLPGGGRYIHVGETPEAIAGQVDAYLKGETALDLNEAQAWAMEQTWEKMASVYEALWTKTRGDKF